MIAFIVFLSMSVAGSLTRWFADATLKLIAARTQNEASTAGPGRPWTDSDAPPVDPILRFGVILALDGIVVLAVVSALPGALALERTGLVFALLCVGGLIGEISCTGVSSGDSAFETVDAKDAQRRSTSRCGSVVLILLLNLTFALLSRGQGLIEILPPKARSTDSVEQLDSVVVVARRTYDPLEDDVHGP